ncbi:hypothetical protein RSOL_468890 [Rhizoctonia solani AG-3 Rhs1AP]|uniref:Uncharacterized protein n=1 Tax=Rhizoctonia solani AG-3 Rhs1AP TaxID=1086054 RepID=X8JIB8_9AGAM|nr:hypothetical protein RSOL_468890 [Rhizoctonia solani AG-3 Rhs1AP]
MAAPPLQPLSLSQPMGTPAAEWAQETVEAIDPNASTGVVTDTHGNPTTDHTKSALAGEPGYGINAPKTAAQLESQRFTVAPVLPSTHEEKTPTNEKSQSTLYTDPQGNPTTHPGSSALSGTPGAGEPLPLATDKSLPPTPAPQLPGGWIRGPGSRQHSVMIPETSLYEDVSAALGTVGQAAANVVESLRNNHKGEANGNANATHAQVQAPHTSTESRPDASVPPRSGSPGILTRAQGMLTGLLARPASPPAKLPVPDAPTTMGEAALVGGGAVANTANKYGENIAAAPDASTSTGPALVGGGAIANTANKLGGNIAAAPHASVTTEEAALVGGGAVANTANKLGDNIAAAHHHPQGAKETEQARLEKEGAGNLVSPVSANTAAQFMNADVPTPDPTRPPKNPGLAGALFPDVTYEDEKNINKANKFGTTLSPDSDVQEAARKSNQDFTVPISGSDSPGVKHSTLSERPQQPTVTKVSDPGVKERLMDVKDMVVAPFAGSRASQDNARSTGPGSPGGPGKTTNVLASNDHSGANPEGIRTTVNPHTAHTSLPPTKEEASDKYVGGTAVITSSPTITKNTGTTASHKGPTLSTGRDETASGTAPTAHQKEYSTGEGENTAGVPIQGISSRGDGQGDIYATEGGAITQRSTPAVNSTSPPGSPNKGVSRLWSRSRRSVDEGTTGSKSTRSRFTEEPSNGSDSASAPTSPSSSRFKVPLKDKIKGELKIISGKVSRNETKVEQGIALKTGQDPTSPIHKH